MTDDSDSGFSKSTDYYSAESDLFCSYPPTLPNETKNALNESVHSEVSNLESVSGHSGSHLIVLLDRIVFDESKLDYQAQLLQNPYNVSKILQLSENHRPRTKLVKYFLWLTRFRASFVADLVENLDVCLTELGDVPREKDDHPLGLNFTINLGTILTECGWHTEAEKVLRNAGTLVQNEDHVVQLLKPLIYWESLTNEPFEGLDTITAAYDIFGRYQLSVDLYVTMCNTMAFYYFQHNRFKTSYNLCLLAFDELRTTTCSLETVVGVLSQLAKSCLSIGNVHSAAHLCTQALNYSIPQPNLYAEALDTVAFYLLMMGSYCHADKIQQRSLAIYRDLLYESLNLPPELVRRELALRLYLQTKEANVDKDWPESTDADKLAVRRRLATMVAVADVVKHLAYPYILDKEIMPLRHLKQLLALKNIS